MKQVDDGTPIEKSEFVYSFGFMSMNHNYLCAVCKTNSGVQECHTGVLQPCWDCQKTGYKVVKLNWFTRLFQ